MNCEFSVIDNHLVCKNCSFRMPYRDRTPRRNCQLAQSTPPELPSLTDQVVHFGKDMLNWGLAGFPVNTQSEHDRRLEICKGCEKFLNGRCASCGCACNWSTWLGGDTKQCPLGKW